MDTALISAGTAAVVTLLVEYAAKPRLEARKDRIIARSKARRELEARLSALLSHRAFVVLEDQSPPSSVHELETQCAALAGEIGECAYLAESLAASGFRGFRGRYLVEELTVCRQKMDELVSGLSSLKDDDIRRLLGTVRFNSAHAIVRLRNYLWAGMTPAGRWRYRRLDEARDRYWPIRHHDIS